MLPNAARVPMTRPILVDANDFPVPTVLWIGAIIVNKAYSELIHGAAHHTYYKVIELKKRSAVVQCVSYRLSSVHIIDAVLCSGSPTMILKIGCSAGNPLLFHVGFRGYESFSVANPNEPIIHDL
jgi:hypothetical protein